MHVGMSLENSICRADAPRVSCRGLGLLLAFLLLTCGARAAGRADSIFVDASSNRDSTMMREERIDQVVVTGTRTPRVLKDVPALTRVVTKREIDAINPRSVDDVLLTTIPGIEFYEHGAQKRMTIQGLGADYYLFLLDGERLCMEGSDAVDFLRINMANIERIEYIAGSGSALYGSNAIGGIINIITRGHSKPAEASYQGTYYTYGQQQHSLHVGLRGHGITSSTDGTFGLLNDYTVANGVDLDGKPVTALVPGMMVWNASQRLSWASPSLRWRISANGGFSIRRQNMDKHLSNRYRSYQAGANAAYQIAPDHSLELNYHLDGYARTELYRSKSIAESNPVFQMLKAKKPIINQADLYLYVDKTKVDLTQQPPYVLIYNATKGLPLYDYSAEISGNTSSNDIVSIGRLTKDNKGDYYYHFYLTDHLTSLVKNGSDNVKIGLAVSTHLSQDTKSTISAMRSISYKNSANEVKKTVLGNAENTLYTVVYGNGSHVAEGKKLKLMVYYTLTE